MIFKAIRFVLGEHKNNIKKILTIGWAHAKKQTQRTSLGIWWVFIRDIIYIFAFIVFRYMMSGTQQVDGMHFVIYLITGIIPWNFMNEVINGGSTAIRSNSVIIKSISFPISIIPTYEVVAIFLKRLFTLVIPFIVVLIFGDIMKFNIFLFLYYFLSMFILMVVFNFIASAIIAISDDFHQLYLAFTRILFFLMPIMWSFEKIGETGIIAFILKLNPMVYLLGGFRDAFVLGGLPSLEYTIYFWVVCFVLLLIGSYTQYKMRKYYADFM